VREKYTFWKIIIINLISLLELKIESIFTVVPMQDDTIMAVRGENIKFLFRSLPHFLINSKASCH
jgi:hypothetical protein